MWVVVLFCATFVVELKFNVLVRRLRGDLGEHLGSWTHVVSTLTIN